ncbi:hypothetical protein MP213Fo_02230 [Pseudochrobactrum sp. MP213Fo]
MNDLVAFMALTAMGLVIVRNIVEMALKMPF